MSEQRHAGLAGINVLDISEGIAAPFCAKLLGDLGADVVKIEPPRGDRSRQLGPFPDDQPHPERSATFFYLNTSKRSVVLDIDSDDGRKRLRDLIARYDIVIASDTAEQLDARGLGHDTLRQWNPRIILTTVSGFGSFGPRSHWQSGGLRSRRLGQPVRHAGP